MRIPFRKILSAGFLGLGLAMAGCQESDSPGGWHSGGTRQAGERVDQPTPGGSPKDIPKVPQAPQEEKSNPKSPALPDQK